MLLSFYLPWKQIHGLKEGSHALQCHVHGFLHQNVEYAEIASIDFMTPTLRWKKSETEVASNATSNDKESSSIQCPSAEELDSFYKSLASKGKHAILSLVPNYCESYKPL